MRSIPDNSPFTRAGARELGWTDAAISRAVRSGRFVRVRHGYLAVPSALDRRARAAAALHACSGSALSHRSALLEVGLPIIGPLPPLPEVTVPPRRIGRLADAHLHRAALPPEHVTVLDGLPITTVARTLIDVGRSLPTASAVAAMDAALHRNLTTVEELYDVARTCWNWPGIRRARRSLALVDGRAESPLESVSRLVLARLGLPKPELQAVLLDERGFPVGRVDFYWDEFGVVGEADGRSKYDSRAVLVAEKERQEVLEDLTAVVTRWGWSDAMHRTQLLRARVEAAFERGRARDRSGFRRKWSVQGR